MRFFAILVLVAGCVSSSSVLCEDGRVCPNGTVCSDSGCVPDTCGNGSLDPREQCDGQQFGSLDCTAFGYYGPAGLSCTACTADPSTCTGGTCGDGKIDPIEGCDLGAPSDRCGDFGFDVGRMTCAASCTEDASACEWINWTQMPSGTTADLTGVWGAAVADMFAVGTGGTILHFNGAGWSPVPSPTTADLSSISGSSANNIIAVGANGTIVRWDGATWSVMPTNTTVTLNGVFVVSATRAFAVGANDTVLRYDGTTWTPMTVPASGEQLHAVWANATDLFIAGSDSTGLGPSVRHFDGSSWSVVWTNSVAGPMLAIYGVSPTDVFIAGSVGDTLHFTGGGSGCAALNCSIVDASIRLFGLWAYSASDVYVVGSDGKIFHWTGAQWVRTDSHLIVDIRAVYSPDQNDVFAVGAHGRIIRRNGIQRLDAVVPSANTDWRGGYTNQDSIAWVAGSRGPTEGVVYMAAGNSSWQFISANPPVLNAIWSEGGYVATAVGESGVIQHGSSAAWVQEHLDNTMSLHGVWGSGANNVFAVGERSGSAVILHSNGTTWTEQTAPSVGTLWAVSGSSATDVYAVGDAGVILHYDGASWSVVRASGPGTTTLYAVWAGADQVIAVGSDIVQRTRGDAWASSPAPATLRALSGSLGSVYAVGDLGTLLRWDGSEWIRIESKTTRQLLVVADSRNDVVFTGRQGFIQRLDLHLGAGVQELDCSDYWDNDLDGLQNCRDPDCAQNPVCAAGGQCRGATNIACGESQQSTTRGGPARFDLFACANTFTTGPERYYRFTPMLSGSVTARLSGAKPDVSITILRAASDGSCDATECIDSAADVTFTATAGETYFLVVDSPDGEDGAHTLELDCLSP